MIGERIQLKHRPLSGVGVILKAHPEQEKTWLVEFEQAYRLWLREADFVISPQLREPED